MIGVVEMLKFVTIKFQITFFKLVIRDLAFKLRFFLTYFYGIRGAKASMYCLFLILELGRG